MPSRKKRLAEVSRYGTATIKRAYGDWTTPNLRSWKDVLHTMAIQSIQQFSYTSGKNATDSALIIDAVDMLHTGSVDGFCLVSSDSEFSRLATYIREAGRQFSNTKFGYPQRIPSISTAEFRFTSDLDQEVFERSRRVFVAFP